MMRRWLWFVLLGWVGAISANGQVVGSSPVQRMTPEGHAGESTRAELEAQKTRDPDAVKNLVTPDFTMVGSDGRVYDKDELIDAAREGRLKSYQIYDVKIEDVGEDVILVSYNLIVTEAEGDNGLAPRYQRVTDLWMKQGEQLRLKFEQASAVRHVD
jgi:hypothetical protein